MVSTHKVPVFVYLIIKVICFAFRFKRGNLTFVRSMFKAFAMPTTENEQRRKPTPICTTPVTSLCFLKKRHGCI